MAGSIYKNKSKFAVLLMVCFSHWLFFVLKTSKTECVYDCSKIDNGTLIIFNIQNSQNSQQLKQSTVKTVNSQNSQQLKQSTVKTVNS